MEENEKNLELYEKFRTPPTNALKEFDNGTFKGTDINSQWRIKMLTSEFGICGIGWYYDIVRTWTEIGENSKETMAFAEIKLYVKQNGEWSRGIAGIGGNRQESWIKKNSYWKVNDECYKMAITDAIGNACKSLGMGADIYWQEDRTKYTTTDEETKVEYCSEEQLNRMKELNVIEENIKARFKVSSLDKLTTAQAQWIINAKEKALAKQSEGESDK